MRCDSSRPIELRELLCSARLMMKLQVALRFRTQVSPTPSRSQRILCRIAGTAYEEHQQSLMNWNTTSHVPEKPGASQIIGCKSSTRCMPTRKSAGDFESFAHTSLPVRTARAIHCLPMDSSSILTLIRGLGRGRRPTSGFYIYHTVH